MVCAAFLAGVCGFAWYERRFKLVAVLYMRKYRIDMMWS